MTPSLSIEQILAIHRRSIQESGGSDGLRDRGSLESAIAQPFQTFAGADLYEGFVAKAAALGYFLIQNHPFVDGNKRTGHAAIDIFLQMHEFEIVASDDEQESMILNVAASEVRLPQFTEWLSRVIEPLGAKNGS